MLTLGAMLASAISACGSDSPSGNGSASPSVGAKGVQVAGVTVTADPTLHDMLPQAISSAGKIRVASNMPYPPWEMYVDVSTKQPTGIDFDLARALSAKLGVEMSFDQVVFDGIIPALLAGKEDIVMAGMWDSKDRQKELDFIDYATDGYGLVVMKGNPEGIATVDDLSGKTVAVQSGTSQVDVLKDLNKQLQVAGKPAVEVMQLPGDSDTLMALKSGKAQAQLDGVAVAAYNVKTFDGGGTFELVDDASVYSTFGSGIVGIGVPKSAPELRDALKAALQVLMDDGTYAAVLAKYGVETVALDAVEINQGE
jgi:polar amino acid transport system substrate-binding protein